MKAIDFFKSINFKIVVIYVLLLIIAVQIIGVFFTNQLEEQLVDNHFSMLEERVNLLEYNVAQEMVRTRGDDDNSLERDISILLNEFFTIDNATIQVVDANQVVRGTSLSQNLVGQLNTEVRVKRALLGTEDEDILLDPQGNRIYVMAHPVRVDDTIVGAIYIEAPMEELYSEMQDINNILATSTFIALVVTMILGIFVARTITRPIVDMKKQARVMSEGDFSRRVKVYGNDEIGQLAISFNNMTRKLKDANATTEGERKKLSSVLTHMTDGVIATDELGRVILMNKRAEQLLNISSEDVEGASLPDLLRLSETIAPSDLYDYSDSILLDFSEQEQEYLLEANFSVIRNEDGPVNGLITVLHDVTEQEKIDRERKEFVANVSHELRTPLTSLKSYLEALEDGAMLDDTLRQRFLKVTQNETERMIRLVNDLLQLSKMDSNDLKLNYQSSDIGSLLHEIGDRFEMVTKDKNIQLERVIPSYPVYIDMDQDKMVQVFDNIISNAVKYSPDGGTITLKLHPRGQNIAVTVRDEGVGIPKENQKKIFDRFYRVDKARARNLGGTGLGLAIAKEMVQAHGGHIGVRSEWEKGTTIIVTLPYSVYKKAGVNE
ncbi:cell wall metabolism sensor histidine kinase WalK [Thalassorhabdus alkalitolerans]|uniref:histidine kinase n=1 Tax=Thalassorhabdus alkalitolerans TaxID=2282697 RepID=A0ABW0YLM1_9BACI